MFALINREMDQIGQNRGQCFIDEWEALLEMKIMLNRAKSRLPLNPIQNWTKGLVQYVELTKQKENLLLTDWMNSQFGMMVYGRNDGEVRSFRTSSTHPMIIYVNADESPLYQEYVSGTWSNLLGASVTPSCVFHYWDGSLSERFVHELAALLT